MHFAFGVGNWEAAEEYSVPGSIHTHDCTTGRTAHHGAPWWHGLVFVAATVLLAGVPLLLLLALGKRARAILPKARDWMTTNSWVVSEIVIVFFLLMALKDVLSD